MRPHQIRPLASTLLPDKNLLNIYMLTLTNCYIWNVELSDTFYFVLENCLMNGCLFAKMF